MEALIQHLGRKGLHPVEVRASADQAMALLSTLRGGRANPGNRVQLSASQSVLLDGNKAKIRVYEDPGAAQKAFTSMQSFQRDLEAKAEDQGKTFFPSHFFHKGRFVVEIKGAKLGADLKPKTVEFEEGFLEKVQEAIESFNTEK
jgi:hypothetical protein